jgi:hypothetical protein
MVSRRRQKRRGMSVSIVNDGARVRGTQECP